MRPAPKRGALPTALWLLRSGFWPVPISSRTSESAGSPGKSPIGRAWGARALTRGELQEAYASHPGAGIGIALGPASGVVDLEVDDRGAAAPLLERVGPGETIGWRSARGDHRVFAWNAQLGQVTDKAVVYLADGAVELRLGGEGKQVAAVTPPTVGSDQRKRVWNGVWEIAPFPERLLEELARVRGERTLSRAREPRTVMVTGSYGKAALDQECAIVRGAPPGTRNQTLNRSAFKLGQLETAALLNRREVEIELGLAAEDAGLPEREATATIRSGIEAGIRKPRQRPTSE